MGHQAIMEPVCRFTPYQTLVGNSHAAIYRSRSCRYCFYYTYRTFFQATLAIFWLMAFSSATHDIAADGFYMLGLTTHEQALFVGIRSTFYRIATIAGQGLLVMIAGYLEKQPEAFPTHGASRSSSWQEYFLRYGSIMPLFCHVLQMTRQQ